MLDYAKKELKTLYLLVGYEKLWVKQDNKGHLNVNALEMALALNSLILTN